MSLVGTRPILQDELLKYELHHRARIAIKPGITGMWQVSGRSDITDFEEVVRLDTEYISKIMENCLPDMSYSATKATNLLNDDTYNEIKNILLESEQWTADLKKLEEDIEHIALRLV